MSGITSILNIAQSGLAANQSALSILSENVANVNSEGYCRQTPLILTQSTTGSTYFAGADRISDSLIQSRVLSQQSQTANSEAQSDYLAVLEALFDESSTTGLGSQLDAFWTALGDLANNPSGTSERAVLIEEATTLSNQYNNLSTQLDYLTIELNSEIATAIQEVNTISDELAQLSRQLVAAEDNSSAKNSISDQIDLKLSELSTYMSIDALQDEDGNLTVLTSGGYPLVSDGQSYSLAMDGTDLVWQGDGSNRQIVTDRISEGTIGAWLTLRDVTIAELSANLDEAAQTLIWEFNSVYSQGVGLEGFDSLTGTYAVDDSSTALGSSASGLTFYDEICDGSFGLQIFDADGDPVSTTPVEITIDADVTSLSDLATAISAANANINASVVDGQLLIEGQNGYTFAFSDDDSNVLAALGLNTFFDGTDAATIAVNSTVSSQTDYLAAGCLDSDTGAIVEGDNTCALNLCNLETQQTDMQRWSYTRGSSATADTSSVSFADYWNSLIGTLGSDSAGASASLESDQALLDSLTVMQEEVSGVSLDEEMTNMIKYQQAYEAAAKLLETAQVLIDTLLEITD